MKHLTTIIMLLMSVTAQAAAQRTVDHMSTFWKWAPTRTPGEYVVMASWAKLDLKGTDDPEDEEMRRAAIETILVEMLQCEPGTMTVLTITEFPARIAAAGGRIRYVVKCDAPAR